MVYILSLSDTVEVSGFTPPVTLHPPCLQMPPPLAALLRQRELGRRLQMKGTHTRKPKEKKVRMKTCAHSQTDPCVSGIPQAQHKVAAEEAEGEQEWPQQTLFFNKPGSVFLT